MAELTFKSPGVGTREIDLSGPTPKVPSGVPAGVIGTALKGPAFVPVVSADFSEFVAVFGSTDGEKFGPLAMNEWLKNAQAGSYVRILGVGDGKKATGDGSVTRAGFVVGAKEVQSNGLVGANPAVGTSLAYSGSLGRTYFLGTFMSASAGVTSVDYPGIFNEANIRPGSDFNSVLAVGVDGFGTGSAPILRGVLLAPSGVLLSLSSSAVPDNDPRTTGGGSAGGFFEEYDRRFATDRGAHEMTQDQADSGHIIGDVDLSSGGQKFALLLNGFKVASSYPNVITASFDPKSPSYFANVFNTDPTAVEAAGHYLYAHYNMYDAYAVVTGSGITNTFSTTGSVGASAFIVTASAGRATSTNTIPNFDSFETRFKTAASPWVTSQNFGGKAENLFKVHVLDDGAYATNKFKISIENISKPTNTLAPNQYGTFDLVVRDLRDTDDDPVVIERFNKLSLNTKDERYIGRIVGDRNVYYDFDRNEGSQKLVVDGLFPNMSRNIRLEIAANVANGLVDQTALPVGFRGPRHLVTSGSSIMQSVAIVRDLANNPVTGSGQADIFHRVVQPPIPMRRHLAVGKPPREGVNASLYWGVQFQVNDNIVEPNKNSKFEDSIESFAKYFPNYDTSGQVAWVGDNAGVADVEGTVLDSDRFNNNRFTLERIQVRVKGTGADFGVTNDYPDAKYWEQARYRRNNTLRYDSNLTSTNSRFMDVSKDFGTLSARPFFKFSFFIQGGFDGVNIFNEAKAKLLNIAAKRETDDATGQGGINGPTVQAYRRAIDVLEQKSNADIQLLAIPGARHDSIVDYAIDAMTDRFDAMYIMDLEERDASNNVVTGSAQNPAVGNTAQAFTSRNLDSSFAATYFPDVIITDPKMGTNVQCPPSVAILGAYSLNDAVAHPWFAPAGFTRGALKSVIEQTVKMSRDNLDELYEADINPITAFPHTPGVVAFGQKTLLAAQSALDRVNVRRLLIEVRRRVRGVANVILFEPNRDETLARFSAAVRPILARIQQQQGIDRFKVVIDTTTTTQADIENNTIRGKIFLQPTRAVEFISLDFVVTNQGANI